ncbi:MAG: hypothetical protein ABSH06_17675 [Thermodesulfobacteriota bacterium]|jgi:hypothetical protein
MGNKIELTAIFNHDSKRFHCFSINEAQGIAGAIYVPKDSAVPDVVTVRLRTRSQAQAEKKREE